MTDPIGPAGPTGAGATPAPELPAQPVILAPGYELPTARQVVGRGLQLAYDSTRDLRRASLYVGLVMLAVAGPFLVLGLVDIPRFAAFPLDDPQSMTREETRRFLALFAPLYSAGLLAILGFAAVAIDASLMAVGILAGRAVGRPLRLREALQRARQVYWRYGLAAFAVGLISGSISLAVEAADGGFTRQPSLGLSLLTSFVATIVVMPFSYVATATVIGDVGAGAALGRSVTLVRARPRLAVVVAAFAFAAAALQTFGLGAAVGVVENLAELLHPSLDLNGPGLIVVGLLAAVGLVALGSLVLTVAAVTTAPQVAAFLGLTHFSAGLDRARQATPEPDAPPPGSIARPDDVSPAAATDLEPSAADLAPSAADLAPDAAAEPPRTYWDQPLPTRRQHTRWITIPMILLIILEIVAAAVGIVSSP
ncbi:MAG TPA: hypothetical protein VGI98_06805 [Candidatus Limnocylindrales bacterium]